VKLVAESQIHVFLLIHDESTRYVIKDLWLF